MSNRILTPGMQTFLGDLAVILMEFDLEAVKEPGRYTPRTPATIEALQLRLVRQDMLSGCYSLKVISHQVGCFTIERDTEFGLGIWVRPLDGQELGHREMVVGIEACSGRCYLSPDAGVALRVIQGVLAAPDVILRG